MKIKKITFVLPHRGRSGGIRSTVNLANGLLSRSYNVRIVYKRAASFSKQSLFKILHSMQRIRNNDWIKDFKGEIESFVDLSQLDFEDGEIVIASGSITVEDVYKLKKPVIKLRHCRGFSPHKEDLMKYAWGVPMPTISVSSTLVPKLEELSGEKVIGIVPNGKDLTQYHDIGLDRDGIGMVFSNYYNKRPNDLKTLITRIRNRWPSVPLYIFGEPRRLREIPRASYWRYPPVVKANELYNRCKIWLLASIEEGMPGPVLEAMACGCAVISTDNVGSLEIIEHGHNGILVPIGDIEAFMENIDLLLNDERKRQNFVNNGFKTVRKFSWDQAVDKMELVLKSLTSQA